MSAMPAARPTDALPGSQFPLGATITGAGTNFAVAARGHYQASLDIAERLTAADPTNTQWQHDLQSVRQKITQLPHTAE
jgi:hypothetical protein